MQFPIYIASLLYVVLLIFIRVCVSSFYDVDVKAIIRKTFFVSDNISDYTPYKIYRQRTHLIFCIRFYYFSRTRLIPTLRDNPNINAILLICKSDYEGFAFPSLLLLLKIIPLSSMIVYPYLKSTKAWRKIGKSYWTVSFLFIWYLNVPKWGYHSATHRTSNEVNRMGILQRLEN